jgi:hypothetical protein
MFKLITRARLGRALAATAVAAAGTAGVLAGTTGSASAVTVFSKFEVLHSGMVMDVANASQANQGPVGQFPFHGGENQQWTRNFVSSIPAGGSNANTPPFELIARHSGKCLDIKGGTSTAVGVPLVQADCDGTVSQQWYTHKVADFGLLTGKGYRYIYNRHSGLVIDVANASQSPAVLVQFPQKPLSQAQNQLWNQGVGGVA